jgi:hypothetical protein
MHHVNGYLLRFIKGRGALCAIKKFLMKIAKMLQKIALAEIKCISKPVIGLFQEI